MLSGSPGSHLAASQTCLAAAWNIRLQVETFPGLLIPKVTAFSRLLHDFQGRQLLKLLRFEGYWLWRLLRCRLSFLGLTLKFSALCNFQGCYALQVSATFQAHCPFEVTDFSGQAPELSKVTAHSMLLRIQGYWLSKLLHFQCIFNVIVRARLLAVKIAALSMLLCDQGHCAFKVTWLWRFLSGWLWNANDHDSCAAR